MEQELSNELWLPIFPLFFWCIKLSVSGPWYIPFVAAKCDRGLVPIRTVCLHRNYFHGAWGSFFVRLLTPNSSYQPCGFKESENLLPFPYHNIDYRFIVWQSWCCHCADSAVFLGRRVLAQTIVLPAFLGIINFYNVLFYGACSG